MYIDMCTLVHLDRSVCVYIYIDVHTRTLQLHGALGQVNGALRPLAPAQEVLQGPRGEAADAGLLQF